MVRFIVGTGLSIGTLLIAYILEGGGLGALVMLSGFLICFFVPLFGVLAIWSWGQWLRAWSLAFRPGQPAEARAAIDLWKFSEVACYLAGLLAALVGSILVLQNWTNGDPGAKQLAHAVAALLVAPTYGVTFGLVCRILRARVEGQALL